MPHRWLPTLRRVMSPSGSPPTIPTVPVRSSPTPMTKPSASTRCQIPHPSADRQKPVSARNNLFYNVTLTPGSYYDWTWAASLGTKTFGGDGLNSNALVINASPLPASDTIRLVETNQYGCVGQEIKKAVIIKDKTPVTTISGPAEVCDRQEDIKFSIPQIAGSTYQWFVPTGSGIISTPNIDSVFVNFGSISGDVNVTETNSAGCVTNHNPLFVTVNPLPASTLGVNKTNICLGEAVTFTAGPAGAANYEFFVDSVSAQTGPGNTYVTDSLTDGQQVFVNVTTIKGCEKASAAITMNVYANPVVTLTSSDIDNTICFGTNVLFTASAAGTVGYQFFLNRCQRPEQRPEHLQHQRTE